MSDLLLAQPYAETMAQLTDRVVLTKPEFLALPDELKMRAFTIARQTEASILQDTLNALKTTVEQGGTLWDFRQNFPDLTAPYTAAGRDWHLTMVFNENVKQAQAVGAYAARKRLSMAFPYVEYISGSRRGDVEPRETHTILDGKIFKVDDPFLDTHTPPWDFNCNCDLIPRTAAQVGAVAQAEPERVLMGGVAPGGGNRMADPAAPTRMLNLSTAAQEYQFRPDRLNQVLDLSKFDQEIRDSLVRKLEVYGYSLAEDGVTAIPGTIPVPGASAMKNSEFRMLNAETLMGRKHLGVPTALKRVVAIRASETLAFRRGRPAAARVSAFNIQNSAFKIGRAA